MKKEYYVITVEGAYMKNCYGSSRANYIYVVRVDDILKAKQIKTLKSALKIKDRIDIYYQTRFNKDAHTKVIKVNMNIDLVEI